MRKPFCAIFTLMLCLTGAALADEAALLDTYEMISPLGNGFYAVRQDGLWGIAGESGEVALEPQLEEEPEFEDGFSVASSVEGRPRMLSGVIGREYDGACGVIDERGAVCVPFAYDFIEMGSGIAMGYREGEGYIYVDMNGTRSPA